MTTFEPISGSDSYLLPDGVEALDQDHDAAIGRLLVGHTVTKVADDHLMLDDGTVLKLFGHDGGCSCSSGCYDLTELNGVDNIITAVEIEAKPDDDWNATYPGVYRIFVFADNQKVNLATFEGTDGNGYYGTGFHILVRRATPTVGEDDVTQTPGHEPAPNPPDWPDPEAMIDALNDIFAPLRAAFTDLGRALALVFYPLDPTAEQARKARVQRMHTAYGRRRR